MGSNRQLLAARRLVVVPALFAVVGVPAAGCSSRTSAEAAPATASVALSIPTVPVEQRPIDRFIRVTGSLVANEQADVGAEIGGRVVATPIERGSRAAAGSILVRVSQAEASAQLQEAEANAAQILARLGLRDGAPFDPRAVPETKLESSTKSTFARPASSGRAPNRSVVSRYPRPGWEACRSRTSQA